MENYASYISLLGSAFGSISAIMGGTLAGLVATWLSGAWIVVLLIPQTSERRLLGLSNEWLWLHPAIIATGWATLIATSTASFYLTKGLYAGKLLLVVLAVVGCILIWRKRPSFSTKALGTFAFIGLATLLMGLWQHAATALPIIEGNSYFMFSSMHLDLPIHVTMAGLIEGSGLPLIRAVPSSTYEFGGPTHIGHALLIASYSSVLGISLYAASTVTWIIATMLTGWCALALLSRRNDLKVGYRLIAVLATLVLGQFTWPWLHDPTNPRAALVTGIWVASRSYWNISQAASIALTMGGLLILDWYCELRRRGQVQLLILAAAVTLITIAGLVKPSLFIFYGPALIIWLAISGARIPEFLVTVSVLQAGVLVYFLPQFLHPLPLGGEGWSFATEPGQWSEVTLFLWYACLSLFIIMIVMIARLIANGWRDRQWQILELGVIALAGSVLFALLFRENQFVGFFVFQPNIWWGISACVVLLVPLISRELVELLKPEGWTRWVVVLGLAVGAIQIINGLHVALAYPVMNVRRHEANRADTLVAARNLTAPNARFALDLSLDHLDLRPFLSRPSLVRTSFGGPDDKQAYSDWRDFIKSGRSSPPLDRLDAVVLQRNRRNANLYFEKMGWQGTPINELFTLWQRVESIPSR